ncbi:hypothetical protein [Streptomyces sp. NPDC010273]|uniref:ATP dependent DNA ligase n=1 Tax=Streptomyces sp. NPDC010273 TaxID=3364829 RepID=UPI0036ED81D5
MLGQEFAIGGFTEPAGSRVGLGALPLGDHEGGRLRHAGKGGTGLTTALPPTRAWLGQLDTSERTFADAVHEARAHRVEPALVARIASTEWTHVPRWSPPRGRALTTLSATPGPPVRGPV